MRGGRNSGERMMFAGGGTRYGVIFLGGMKGMMCIRFLHFEFGFDEF